MSRKAGSTCEGRIYYAGDRRHMGSGNKSFNRRSSPGNPETSSCAPPIRISQWCWSSHRSAAHGRDAAARRVSAHQNDCRRSIRSDALDPVPAPPELPGGAGHLQLVHTTAVSRACSTARRRCARAQVILKLLKRDFVQQASRRGPHKAGGLRSSFSTAPKWIGSGNWAGYHTTMNDPITDSGSPLPSSPSLTTAGLSREESAPRTWRRFCAPGSDQGTASAGGIRTSDEPRCNRLTPSLAVVETVDFFPPVVDDPFPVRRDRPANALSDIWAMGARPLFALNWWLSARASLEMLSKILAAVGARRRKRHPHLGATRFKIPSQSTEWRSPDRAPEQI